MKSILLARSVAALILAAAAGTGFAQTQTQTPAKPGAKPAAKPAAKAAAPAKATAKPAAADAGVKTMTGADGTAAASGTPASDSRVLTREELRACRGDGRARLGIGVARQRQGVARQRRGMAGRDHRTGAMSCGRLALGHTEPQKTERKTQHGQKDQK